MSFSDMVVKYHSFGGMIPYAGEWHERGSWSYGESSRKSTLDISSRLVSCGYELILYSCTMPMFMLWTSNVEGYISEMKVV